MNLSIGMNRIRSIRFMVAILIGATSPVLDFPNAALNANAVTLANCVTTTTGTLNTSVTVSSSKCRVQFNSGTGQWRIPGGVSSFEVLVVGGGGGGGADGGGGGGGGGVYSGVVSISGTTVESATVIVGVRGLPGVHSAVTLVRAGSSDFTVGRDQSSDVSTLDGRVAGDGRVDGKGGFSEIQFRRSGVSTESLTVRSEGGNIGNWASSGGTGGVVTRHDNSSVISDTATVSVSGSSGGAGGGVGGATAGSAGVAGTITTFGTFGAGGGGGASISGLANQPGGAGGTGGGGAGGGRCCDSNNPNFARDFAVAGTPNTGGGGGGGSAHGDVGEISKDGNITYNQTRNARSGGLGVVVVQYTPDTTAPTATWTAPSSPSTSRTLSYNLAFSETVSGIIAADFANQGTAAGCSFTPSASSGTSVTVTVTCTSDGTVVLRLTSGTVADAAGNTNASNVDAGSVTIDATDPTVTAVSSSASNGSYNAGDLIEISVTFSETVVVTGTPRLTLETGSNDRTVNFFSYGSDDRILIFQYLVQDGDTSSDLDYIVTNPLTLNGGSIKDEAGNNASLTLPSPGAAGSLGANKSIIIDTTAPTPTWTAPSSPSPSRTLAYTLGFSETVTGIAAGDFSNQGTASCSTFTPSASSGISVTITVTCTSDGTLILRLGAGLVADAAGNTNASNVDASSVTIDATAPTLSSASVAVNGRSITLTYNETLSATTAGTSAFFVSRLRLGWINSETMTVSSAPASGVQVTLNLPGTIFSGDSVTVSYTDPSGSNDTNAVQDSAGNDAASFSNQAVTNNSTVKRNQDPLSIVQSSMVYGETLTVTTTGGLGNGAVTFTENSAACTILGTTLTGDAVGNCIVTATKEADDVFLETTTTKTIVVTQASQTITFSSLANKTLGMSVAALSATASSGLTVSFSSSTLSQCTVFGTTLTLLTAGTCTITASQAGNANFAAASTVSRSFTISPTLLLSTPSSGLSASYGAPFSLNLALLLSGGSGGTSYAITTGSLPPGLSLTTSTGLISGTPTSLADSALVITVTDSNGATSSTSSFTISVVTGSATATIAFASTTMTFGITNAITVTVSTAGKVRFSANGKVIRNCKEVSTVTSGSITATCSYRPATRRPLTITARLTPTDTNIAERTSTSAQFLVGRRTGTRG